MDGGWRMAIAGVRSPSSSAQTTSSTIPLHMDKNILHSKIEGQGAPFLILHGFLGMLDNWKTLGGQYAEAGFEVHLIDQRNHGHSFWSENFNYDLLAEDVEKYMSHHGLQSAVVLGHSMGGKTAMQFACDHSERVT